jgi:hypothetical protein
MKTIAEIQKELSPTNSEVLTLDQQLLIKGGGIWDDKRRGRPGTTSLEEDDFEDDFELEIELDD